MNHPVVEGMENGSGTKYMTPYDISVLYSFGRNREVTDIFADEYYSILYREKKIADAAGEKAKRIFSPISALGMSDLQQKLIRQSEIIQGKLYSESTNSLGIILRKSKYTQHVIVDLELTPDEGMGKQKSGQYNLRRTIEEAFSTLLKLDRHQRVLKKTTDEYTIRGIHVNMSQLKTNLLSHFFIEKRSSSTSPSTSSSSTSLADQIKEYSVKDRFLVAELTLHKGKKLFIQSLDYISMAEWVILLSVLLPYMLTWVSKDSNKELSQLILNEMKERVMCEEMSVDGLCYILKGFIDYKRSNEVPAILEHEMCAPLMEAFVNRGDLLSASANEGMLDGAGEEASEGLKWTEVMSELQKIIEDS